MINYKYAFIATVSIIYAWALSYFVAALAIKDEHRRNQARNMITNIGFVLCITGTILFFAYQHFHS